ncbi:related to Glycosylphosphatidylinositol anchor biosynthesis protein 11 [Saccharomycodes ludwigii]|uniref:Glycosylphosphatidylinositol anchor biosynthesis protein 11 n=1 Tax=Saccharomycodes ludwigii TaxID=36035 RepID=A0A376BBC2_9ASCO|nr:hypothetical protein SCDLUD_004629 [Saccharomycodes ludwigii]KAH3899199.1 hypothetical protein SCDLUD_004629 [Saccharomycodes ludwigii]SSD61988.1 related to Glycosylphosphatidylinositol anchor biosynthesis protein 11 [Saccharomycodes ludwigii]
MSSVQNTNSSNISATNASNAKKRKVKKSVTFSDYDTVITPVTNGSHNGRNKSTSSSIEKRPDGSHYPVVVRKSISTVPFHLIPLVYYYMKTYDIYTLFYLTIPTQVFYLLFQFRKNTIFAGKKILKPNWALVIVSLVFAVPLLSCVATIIFILAGAPLLSLSYLKQTFLLSLHCCLLSYPAIYSVFNCDFKVGIFKKYFVAIAFGCWLSCFVIPLDWDREWQNWPIPLVIGGYLGAFVGYAVGAYI